MWRLFRQGLEPKLARQPAEDRAPRAPGVSWIRGNGAFPCAAAAHGKAPPPVSFGNGVIWYWTFPRDLPVRFSHPSFIVARLARVVAIDAPRGATSPNAAMPARWFLKAMPTGWSTSTCSARGLDRLNLPLSASGRACGSGRACPAPTRRQGLGGQALSANASNRGRCRWVQDHAQSKLYCLPNQTDTLGNRRFPGLPPPL